MRVIFIDMTTDIEITKEAFAEREIPRLVSISGQLAEHEFEDIRELIGKDWSFVDAQYLDDHFEFLLWLPPDAFCYYLPGVIVAGLRSNRFDFLVYDYLVSALAVTSFDNLCDFVRDRFNRLSFPELIAVHNWLLWISRKNDGYIDDLAIFHALQTIGRFMEGKE